MCDPKSTSYSKHTPANVLRIHPELQPLRVPSVAKVLLPLVFSDLHNNLGTNRDTITEHGMISIHVCSIHRLDRMLFCRISFRFQVRGVKHIRGSNNFATNSTSPSTICTTPWPYIYRILCTEKNAFRGTVPVLNTNSKRVKLRYCSIATRGVPKVAMPMK